MAPLNKILPSSPGAGVQNAFSLSSVVLALMAALFLILRYRNRSSRLAAIRSKNNIEKTGSTPLTCRKAKLKPFLGPPDANVSLPSQEISREAVQRGCGKAQALMDVPEPRDSQMECSAKRRQGLFSFEGMQNAIPLNDPTDVHPHHDDNEKARIPYPVPSEVVARLSSSYVEYHARSPDVNAGLRKLPHNDETMKENRPLRTAGLRSETVQIFCDVGLDQPRKWRRRILEYS